jgi:hypothetical protein
MRIAQVRRPPNAVFRIGGTQGATCVSLLTSGMDESKWHGGREARIAKASPQIQKSPFLKGFGRSVNAAR